MRIVVRHGEAEILFDDPNGYAGIEDHDKLIATVKAMVDDIIRMNTKDNG